MYVCMFVCVVCMLCMLCILCFLCYPMSCYVVICHDMSCHVMLCHVSKYVCMYVCMLVYTYFWQGSRVLGRIHVATGFEAREGTTTTAEFPFWNICARILAVWRTSKAPDPDWCKCSPTPRMAAFQSGVLRLQGTSIPGRRSPAGDPSPPSFWISFLKWL